MKIKINKTKVSRKISNTIKYSLLIIFVILFTLAFYSLGTIGLSQDICCFWSVISIIAVDLSIPYTKVEDPA